MLNTFLSKSLLIVALFFITTQITTAQTISGRVIDAQTKETLVGATVVQTDTQNGRNTDSNGEFSLQLQDGARSLTVSFVGYKTKTVTIIRNNQELEIQLLPTTYIGGEVFVEATRVGDSIPMSYTNFTREELDEKNMGQDLPYLIQSAPSVISTSDAGAGVGYTGMRIRGVDPTRVNITINGIPVNNSESQAVYWVNMPDISTSVDNIQIQRGVGASSNGVGAFGASVNLQTSSNRTDAFAEVNTGLGSFNTQKANILVGSGLMKNGWQFEGRLSKILSDGFIDRASSVLNSHYLSAAKHGKRSLLKLDIFSGKEITYQAWNGVEESILKSGNRTYNEIGTDKAGDPYENQVDNYQQNIYQLHYSYSLADNWIANASLHYTQGKGYFEEYKADKKLSDYNIAPLPGNPSRTDVISRRWLDNHFYGAVFNTKYTHSDTWNLTFGGAVDRYDGDHFGEVVWARYAGNSEMEDQYYFNDAVKYDYNVYGKLQYLLTESLNAYLDLQVRGMNYEYDGVDVRSSGNVDIRANDDMLFFNPKFGLVYRKNNHRLFTSFGVTSKEPSRDEYVKSSIQSRPRHETLYNIETGYRGEFNRFFVGINGYGMFYNDQLILTGQVNDTGRAIRQNIPDSYRIGLELEGGVRITNYFNWAANATLSQNKIKALTEYIDDYDNGGQITRAHKNTDIALSPSLIANSIFNYTRSGFTTEFSSKYVAKQYLDNTQNDARSIDAYFVSDLRLAYKLQDLLSFKAVTASMLVNNIFNTEYESNGYTYGFISGGEERYNYYFPQAGTNFLFQIKWEF
ncbi:MAG: TonB-dependent receptor [Balneolaceae bacterium]